MAATKTTPRNKRNNYGRGYELVFADGSRILSVGASASEIKTMEARYGKLREKRPL